ncbi:MAG: GGDEF domain-containing protein, partial [Proteobacteria bacterium]|nr:GGDEF domain-containing protein [Pseudomonadota bacterium]
AVMIGDIDFFKRINDRFSHATGDEVLRHVGRILAEHTRASDVVARYGGEEFVIAFPETEIDEAAAFCERLRQIIEAHPWRDIQPELAVTMSMGLNGDLALGSVEKMLAAADALLYQAKQAGRNRVLHRSVAAVA